MTSGLSEGRQRFFFGKLIIPRSMMYWELWLSQLAATDALQSVLVQKKGRQALFVAAAQLRTMFNEHEELLF